MRPELLAPEYLAARTVLLNALEVLVEHRGSLVLVGAQAVYARTGGAGLISAPFTDDGDLAIDVSTLASRPGIEELMLQANFRLKAAPSGSGHFQAGQWECDVVVDGRTFTPQVDLIVPRDTLAGRRDQRGARLPEHGRRVAMRTHGLEAAVIDNDPLMLAGLAPGDDRAVSVNVAGVAALAVAKLHKLSDRVSDSERPHRQSDKDAADLYRLIRVTPAAVMAERLHTLRNDRRAQPAVEEALLQLPRLFGRSSAPGVMMAARSVAGDVAPATVTTQLTAYTRTLLGLLAALADS